MRAIYYTIVLVVLIYNAQQFVNGNMDVGTYLMVNVLCFLFGYNVRQQLVKIDV